jgi:phosphohistidine phosphatase SixA
MRKIAGYIKEHSKDSLVYLASSDVKRAIESAKVLSDELSLHSAFDKNAYLYDGPNKHIMDLIDKKRRNADVCIVVGHLDFVDSFPSEFYNSEFGTNDSIRGLYRGEAIHIDLEKRIYEILPK